MAKKISLGTLLFWLVLLGLAAVLLYKIFVPAPKDREMGRSLPVPVRVAKVLPQDVPYFLNGLGTVLPSSDVLVKSRVNGQLIKVHFKEGQYVKKGQLLAEIDPRPFLAALQEAKGKLTADEAQLKNAKRDLGRYGSLVKGDFVERQKYDTQQALVGQLAGSVAADKAAVETARLQLEYSRITAPSSGVVGLRKVDVGNQITSSDSEGLVRITEMNPCDVLFTLPETNLPLVLQAIGAGGASALPVQAWDREQTKMLALGQLLSVDNEIDRQTGTVRLKARFSNDATILYPNQFVNIRIRVRVESSALTVPVEAIQVGSKGTYVYVLKELSKPSTFSGKEAKQPKLGQVERRLIRVRFETARIAILEGALSAEDLVVVDGLDRLREGAVVQITEQLATPQAEPLTPSLPIP